MKKIKSAYEENYQSKLRVCDALVLGYDSKDVLAVDDERKFYIPSRDTVEEAFGYSLRSIFGTKKEGSHWADNVRWLTIKRLDKLEKRILEGTKDIITGNPDYQTFFENYFSDFSGRFNSYFVYMKGTFYMFRTEQRKKAVQEFQSYWTAKEKARWAQIHNYMRQYTRKEFKQKPI